MIGANTWVLDLSFQQAIFELKLVPVQLGLQTIGNPHNLREQVNNV
jgi:hypothetical protein